METVEYLTRCFCRLINQKYDELDADKKKQYEELVAKFSNLVLQRVEFENTKKRNDEIEKQIKDEVVAPAAPVSE